LMKFAIPNQAALLVAAGRNALKTWTSIITIVAQPLRRSMKTRRLFTPGKSFLLLRVHHEVKVIQEGHLITPSFFPTFVKAATALSM